ncbi:MAG: sugar transporter, partial [Frankiales bacterium]|nr:sugar transporter [Frankiales bacterium]
MGTQWTAHGRAGRRRSAAIAALAAGSLALAACGSSSSGSSGGSSGGGSNSKVGVSLILKTLSNPYFVSMENDAKTEAAKDNVTLTVAAGKTDGD